MPPRFQMGRDVLRCAAVVTAVISSTVWVSARSAAQSADTSARVREWPCRLIAKPTLLDVVDDGWRRSATLRRQCEELASARAIVVLEWGAIDSSHASGRMGVHDGVVIATVIIPQVRDAIELVAHELQHVLERVRGIDFEAEAKRRGSGVRRILGGYETQSAIETGRQVARELRDTPRLSENRKPAPTPR
jgi:hypothetical protein